MAIYVHGLSGIFLLIATIFWLFCEVRGFESDYGRDYDESFF